MSILKIIKQEIEKSGKSRNQIAINAGVEPAILCRLMQGGSIKVETAEKLLLYFGYSLTKGK
jgi:hypothetical protein